MASRRSNRRHVVAILVIALWATRASGATISEMIVFGDSLSDTGNVLTATQLSQFTSNPYDVRPDKPWYDTGRWTNGPANTGSDTTTPKTTPTAFGGVWHERLADKLKINRAGSVIADGTNWAFGGATTGTGKFAEILLNVGEQVKTYLNTNPAIKPTQLFALWGGGNDLRDAAHATGATIESIKAAAATALSNMKSSIAALVAKGAKLFLWPNLPPLERTPEALAMNAALRDGLQQAAEQFRDGQAAAVTMLEDAAPGVAIYTLDVHGEFSKIATSPADFGIHELSTGVITVTGGKYSEKLFSATPNFPDLQVDSDAFLFWDQIHPTARAHELIAAQAFSILIPEPATVTLAAAALLVCVLRFRRNPSTEELAGADG